MGPLPNLAGAGLNVAPPGCVRHSEAGGFKGPRERPQQRTGRASARPVLRGLTPPSSEDVDEQRDDREHNEDEDQQSIGGS